MYPDYFLAWENEADISKKCWNLAGGLCIAWER